MSGTSEQRGQLLEVFYSYAPEDEGFQRELAKHLTLLQRQGQIAGWHHRDISAGTDWAKETHEHLNSAQIILLLISTDFLASDYCYSVEMQRALERHEAREAHVIPIILRPVSWEGAPFSKLQMLPRESLPIMSKQWENRDEAWTHVVQELRKVIASLKTTIPIPSPAPAPRIWHVPYRRNPFFTGREDLLQQIHDRFTTSNSGNAVAISQPQAISGLGGIGKTQTSLEYANRYRRMYRTVLWVSASSKETLETELVALARVLGLPEQRDQQSIIAAVKAWLTEQRDWLLILDNADDLSMIRGYLPEGESTNGHILLTTRAQAVGSLAHKVEVEQMDPAEGALLLLRRVHLLTPETTLEQATIKAREEAQAIVAELGGLPLAIDQAGAYIEETGCSLAGYLDLYRSRRKELLQRRSTLPTDHPEPVATTWDLSFRLVEHANPAGAELLRLCAFLDPDAIAESLLTRGAEYLGDVLAPVVANPFAFNQAIEELRKFSLIRRNADAQVLSVHRLEQVVLKDAMPEEQQREWAERAVQVVNAAFPGERWQVVDHLLPHALACASLIEQYQLASPETAWLLDRTATYLQDRALYRQAEPLFQRALAIYKIALVPEHRDTAETLNNLALLYRVQGRYTEAEPLFQRALAICEKALDPDHPDTATILENYVLLLREMKREREAVPLEARAKAIHAKHRS
jgi:tetratricopeptide (TPR) repeat protein